VSFFQPFTEDDNPIECIVTQSFTHIIKQVEKDIWLNFVLTYPDNIFGPKKTVEEEQETIANQQVSTQQSLFQEEDTRIFLKLIDAFHNYFCLFHGSMQKLLDEYEKKDP